MQPRPAIEAETRLLPSHLSWNDLVWARRYINIVFVLDTLLLIRIIEMRLQHTV